MEALSIQAVKAKHGSASMPPQSGLGEVFQIMLRDSVEQQETSAQRPRVEERPRPDAPQRNRPEQAAGVAGDDRRDPAYDTDTNNDAHEASGTAEPRQTASDDTVRDREAPSHEDAAQAANPPQESERPAENRETQEIAPAADGSIPSPDSTQGLEEPIAAAGVVPASTPEQVIPNTAPVVPAPAAGTGGQTDQANVTSGKTTGAPTPAAPVSNQAQNSAPSQPPASSTPAPAAGNRFSANVTVTPGQVVSTPKAGLGGGAATAAIAAANNPATTAPVTAQPEQANRAAQGTPVSTNQSPQGAGGQPGTAAKTAAIPTDGQTLAGQTASTAVAAPSTQKPAAGQADAQIRNGAAANAPVVNAERADAPVQNGLMEPASTQPAPGKPVPGSAPTAQNVPGQNDGVKTGGAPQAASQPQPEQTAKAANQNAAATNPQAAAVQGTQARDAGPRGGANPADTASSRVSSAPTPATPATGGFAQAAVGTPDTLGSLTRSGGTQPTTATQIAVDIQKAVNAGKDHIRIRLHPAELGQIDVSLKVRHDGTVKLVVTTDQPDTFDMFQRDARGLERALQDAGLKTDSGSLSFHLRGGEQQGPNSGQRQAGTMAQSGTESDPKAESPPPDTEQPIQYVSNRALDIHV